MKLLQAIRIPVLLLLASFTILDSNVAMAIIPVDGILPPAVVARRVKKNQIAEDYSNHLCGDILEQAKEYLGWTLTDQEIAAYFDQLRIRFPTIYFHQPTGRYELTESPDNFVHAIQVATGISFSRRTKKCLVQLINARLGSFAQTHGMEFCPLGSFKRTLNSIDRFLDQMSEPHSRSQVWQRL